MYLYLMCIVNMLWTSMLFTFEYIHVAIKCCSLFSRMIFNDFTLDLKVDAQEISHGFIKNIKFFFSRDIYCPVDGCPPAQLYATKARFQ